jgi:hypothetical protein
MLDRRPSVIGIHSEPRLREHESVHARPSRGRERGFNAANRAVCRTRIDIGLVSASPHPAAANGDCTAPPVPTGTVKRGSGRWSSSGWLGERALQSGSLGASEPAHQPERVVLVGT